MIYDPIDDWTPEGRIRLVAARGDEIRALLDLAFTEFVETHEVGLSSFGFRGDDPVGEAVEWSMKRFVDADINPAHLHPGSRSLRLFTEARFWLHQKVGREGYGRLLAAPRSPEVPREEAHDGGEEGGPDLSAIEAFGKTLALTLRTLGQRTCADLIGFWLEATRTLRREWFGWRDRGEVSGKGAALSKKTRSFYGHDAMFRFLCFLHDLVPPEPEELADRALLLTTLSPCENTPPYRVPDGAVLPLLARLGVQGPREVAHLRKEGAKQCMRRCAERAFPRALATAAEMLAAELTRQSLGPTTLHALGIEDDIPLREQIGALSKPSAEASS